MNSSSTLANSPGTTRPLLRWWIVLGAVHVAACVTMWAVPKVGLFPSLTTPSGFWLFAVDASDFHVEAGRLANLFRDGGWSGWWSIDAEAHTRFVSLLYFLFGSSTLSALPFMTGTYLLIVFTAARLGALLFGRRAGLVAAAIIGAWPSFLLHSTQLLKDPPFVLGQLAFVTGMVLLLVRGKDDWRRYVAIAAWSVTGFYVAYSVRAYTAELNIVIWLLALVLLAVAAVYERQIPWRKAATALVVLLILGQSIRPGARASGGGVSPVAPFTSAAVLMRSDKQAVWSIEQLANPRMVVVAKAAAAPVTVAQKLEYWLLLVVDKRNDFSRFDIVGGSNIDRDVTFATGADVIGYLPRAVQVGMAAPFPAVWFTDFSVVRLFAAFETMFMYVCIPLALISVWRHRGDVAVWLALLVAVGGMTMLGLIIPNVGIIFRLRYAFWFVMVVVASPQLLRLAERIWPRESSAPRDSVVSVSVPSMMS